MSNNQNPLSNTFKIDSDLLFNNDSIIFIILLYYFVWSPLPEIKSDKSAGTD